MSSRILALSFLQFAIAAHAGDTVYQCKTANGIEFSDRPCANADQTQAVKKYAAPSNSGETPVFDPFAAPASASVGNTTPDNGRDASSFQTRDEQPDRTAGYQCTGNGKVWIQASPCPASTRTAVPVMGVSGTDQHGGQFSNGMGTVWTTTPVKQQALSHSEVCDQLRSNTQTSEHDSGQSSVYERNKMRQAEGC